MVAAGTGESESESKLVKSSLFFLFFAVMTRLSDDAATLQRTPRSMKFLIGGN